MFSPDGTLISASETPHSVGLRLCKIKQKTEEKNCYQARVKSCSSCRSRQCCSLCPRGFSFTWWGCCGSCLWHKPTELAHSFLFCSCVCFCLYGPFNCISFHKFSRQLSAFSLCSSGLISALLGPFNCISLYESLPQPWYNLLWLTGLKAPTK